MSVELLGYSERGVVNAICEDIRHSTDPHSKLAEFLSWFKFLEGDLKFSGDTIKKALLLVEQGFSDFGDLDLLVLVEFRSGQKLCLLIEAKVSTDTNNWPTVGDRWREFVDQLAGNADKTSNLFVQLHRKVRLVAKLRAEGDFETDCLVPRGSTGVNQVVSRACSTLKEYLAGEGSAWFGAILPDAQSDLISFAEENFQAPSFGDAFPTWNADRWGLLSWQVVAANVDGKQWPRTKATLAWNKGQIFRDAPPVRSAIQTQSLALHGDRLVYVVDCDEHNCRVVPLDVPNTGYFWKTCKVRVDELVAAEGHTVTNLPCLPRSGTNYTWESRNELPIVPEGEPAPGLADGSSVVVVKRPSWVTTRVRLARGPTDTFLVFTHQLRRETMMTQNSPT